MAENKSWSDKQIAEQIEKSSAKATFADKVNYPKIGRNLLIIGCGDGGCNIASMIHDRVPESYAIAYNTSQKAMDHISADVKIIPAEEDGSGKAREYSQDVFKKGSHVKLLETTQAIADKMTDLEYIIVTTTADGGTGGGVSPMVAKFLNDNMEVPVIILGVYPALTEDATAQFNAMRWQQDVEKTELPYIILDNNCTGTKMQIHNKINNLAADVMSILSGIPFGETNISSIDNRDMYTLLSGIGGRVFVAGSSTKPTVGQSIDDYLMTLVKDVDEPEPFGLRGIGLFIKGPADFIKKADTSLQKFTSTYGEPAVQYNHMEEANEVYIAVVCSGCDEPTDRLYMMRQRYDDIQEAGRKTTTSMSDILSGADNPLGFNPVGKKTRPKSTDLSALDL